MLKNNPLIFLLAICTLTPSCASSSDDSSQKPLYVAIGYDISGSVADFPALTDVHVERLVSLVNRRGGTLAFGLIDERAIEPLDCLELLPVIGRLDQRARTAVKNREAISDWKNRVAAKIGRTRNAPRTDFYGALAQIAL